MLEDSYFETQKERSAIASSVKNQNAANGMKQTGIPSRKEFIENCGEVSTYNLSKPMTWKQFNLMPKDLQYEYITKLMNEFHVPAVRLAKMFNVSDFTVRQRMQFLNIKVLPKGMTFREDDKKKWEEFLYQPVKEDEIKEERKECEMRTESFENSAEKTVMKQANNNSDSIEKVADKVKIKGNIELEGEVTSVIAMIQNLVKEGSVRIQLTW